MGWACILHQSIARSFVIVIIGTTVTKCIAIVAVHDAEVTETTGTPIDVWVAVYTVWGALLEILNRSEQLADAAAVAALDSLGEAQ